LGTTALMLAAQNGDLSVVRALQHADVGTKDDEARTALYFAAGNGHSLVVKHLIEQKADLNAREALSWTALMIASSEGWYHSVKRLIHAKADLNVKSSDGGTALMFAAKNGFLNIVCALVESKAKVNAQDSQNKTALMLAVKEDRVKVVKWLVRHGKASVYLQGFFGSVLDLARRQGKAAEIEGKPNLKLADWLESVACSFAGCNEPAFKRCGRCKLAKYCGSACQKKHWREHQSNCLFLV